MISHIKNSMIVDIIREVKLYGSNKNLLIFAIILILSACSSPGETGKGEVVLVPKSFAKVLIDTNFISFSVDPDSQIIQTYWLGANGKPMRHFNALEGYVKKFQQNLVFSMNGGMFKEGYSPVGLYIEKGQELSPIDSSKGKGNFYLLPNGVFYIDSTGVGGVVETSKFILETGVAYATQSGPMLLIDGAVHPAFRQNSTNLNIRNGVGILPDGRIHLAMSKRSVNFYAFAEYFQKLGCKQALYLDGFVSRVYDSRTQERGEDGRFGVMIGVSEKWEQ